MRSTLLYIVLNHLQPKAFSFGISTASGPLAEQQLFRVRIYFSLTTLATIGYGDITPVTLQARYAAVAEGITGQFYLAILVARLVSLYMSRPVNSDAGRQMLRTVERGGKSAENFFSAAKKRSKSVSPDAPPGSDSSALYVPLEQM